MYLVPVSIAHELNITGAFNIQARVPALKDLLGLAEPIGRHREHPEPPKTNKTPLSMLHSMVIMCQHVWKRCMECVDMHI